MPAGHGRHVPDEHRPAAGVGDVAVELGEVGEHVASRSSRPSATANAGGGRGEALAERVEQMRPVRRVRRPPALGDHLAMPHDHQAVRLDAGRRLQRVEERADTSRVHSLRGGCALGQGSRTPSTHRVSSSICGGSCTAGGAAIIRRSSSAAPGGFRPRVRPPVRIYSDRRGRRCRVRGARPEVRGARAHRPHEHAERESAHRDRVVRRGKMAGTAEGAEPGQQRQRGQVEDQPGAVPQLAEGRGDRRGRAALEQEERGRRPARGAARAADRASRTRTRTRWPPRS